MYVLERAGGFMLGKVGQGCDERKRVNDPYFLPIFCKTCSIIWCSLGLIS